MGTTVPLLSLMLMLLGSVGAAVGFRLDGRGHYASAEPPTEFSQTKNVVWSTAMPSWSNASPVVVGDRVFVCAEPDLLIAVDKATGRILWQHANPIVGEQADEPPAKAHTETGFTTATPVTDGAHVYACFGNGLVAAYDLSGKRLWSRFVERTGHIWGHAASPLLVAGRLLVHFRTLLALDPATGEEVWRQPREQWGGKKRWGTAAPARIGGVEVVVTVSGRVIRAADGEVLLEDLGTLAYASPLVVGDVVYFMDGGKGRAVRLPATTDGEAELLWETKTARDRYYSSAAFLNGVVYTIARGGAFSAFRAADGRELYRERLDLRIRSRRDLRNTAYASVTIAGGLVFLAGMDGSVVCVEPGEEYRQRARNMIEEELRANPVFEGRRLYLRAPGRLYCFGE